MKRQLMIGLCLATLSASGCGQPDPVASEQVPLTQRIALIDTDLSPGDQGERVSTVQEYLAQIGYFPNSSLRARWAAWRPIVSQAPIPGQFDERTSEALRAFQKTSRLPETGVVDADTRAQMKMARCGVPDGMPIFDPGDKFSISPQRWGSTSVTWKLTNTQNNITLAQAREAIRLATEVWSAQTNFTFTQVTSGSADITMNFANLGGLAGLAGTTPASGPITAGTISFGTNADGFLWSTSDITPAGSTDLETIAIHEIGHVLGLGHSSFSTASLRPVLPANDRTLDTDDKVAISSIYDGWQLLPGLASDISVGGDGSVWVVGTNPVAGGFEVFKFVSGGWVKSSGGATRIAVDPQGKPWVVNSFHQILQRTTNDPLTGGWTLKGGAANDIGVGQNGSVWVISNTVVGTNFAIAKYNTSTNSLNFPVDGGAGIRVSVGITGRPWLVNSTNDVYRRTVDSTSSGGWAGLPGKATDIGVNGNVFDVGQYAWATGTTIVGGGVQIMAWDEQAAGSAGFPPPVAEFRWITLPGGATTISVGPDGAPWIINNANQIFKTIK